MTQTERNATFTPGPWVCEPEWSEVFHRFNSARTVRIADCGTTGMRVDEAQANARLIATAPDLLEALRWFCKRVDDGEVQSVRTYARFKELIAQAEGRES